MTTYNHSAIATGESNAASTWNTRFADLDAAIGQLTATGVSGASAAAQIRATKDRIDNLGVEAGNANAEVTAARTSVYYGGAASGVLDNLSDSLRIASGEIYNVKAYGALGDGSGDTVAEWLTGGSYDRGYANLAAIQVDYAHVTATTDTIDWAAFQAAVNAAITNDGQVFVPAGRYIIERTITVDNDGTASIVVIGAGAHATILEGPTTGFTGDCILDVIANGPSTLIAYMTIQVASGGSTAYDCINAEGDGLWFTGLWLASARTGLWLTNASTVRVSDCVTEFNQVGFRSTTAGNGITFINCHTYQNSVYGWYLAGTKSLSGAQTAGAMQLVAPACVEDGTAAIYIETNVPVNITSPEIISYNNQAPNYGIYIVSPSTRVTISNPTIAHTEIAGIYITSDTAVTVTGGIIYRVGYYDQSTPWACYGIHKAGNNGTLTVLGTHIIDGAGFGIKTQAVFNQILGVFFSNNTQGGSDGGGVSTTTGNYALWLDPQSTGFQAKVQGCIFNAAGTNTGKTAVYIGNTAVPTGGKIALLGNDVAASAFATTLGTALTGGQLATMEFIANVSLYKNTPHRIGEWAWADAPVNTLFLASDGATAGKLTWKDSGGSVHALN